MNFKNTNKALILSFIFIIGLGLRVWRVGNYPPLLWDEASLGYNAYSILKTGKDEYGQSLPLIFKSFGDYKPGFYIYLTIPFIWLMGLSQLAVRLPAVILGSLTSVIFYLLIKEITRNEKLSLVSAVVLALLPWHIHFSRGAWEVNVMVFFVTLGSWLFIKGIKELNFFVFSGSLFTFLLALITYQGAKLVVPLIGLGLVYLLLRFESFKLKKLKKYFTPKFLIPCSVFIILAGSWYFLSFSGSASNRLKVMSLFSYRRPETEINQILEEDGMKTKGGHYYIFHGEWLHFFKGFASRYLNHFSPKFLAFTGDWQNARHSVPYFGVISHLGFVLLILGVIIYLKEDSCQDRRFFLYWLLVAPLPAALTRDSVSSVRALTMVIPLSYFIGLGVSGLTNLKINKFIQVSVYCLLITAFTFDFGYYLDLYHNHLVKLNPKQWLYGYQKAVEFVVDNQEVFDQVIMTDFYGQPYIYYLFTSLYPPSQFQKQAEFSNSSISDVGTVKKIDKINFQPINWKIDSQRENTLIIISEDEVWRNELDKQPVMEKFKPIGKIDGHTMFYGFKSGE